MDGHFNWCEVFGNIRNYALEILPFVLKGLLESYKGDLGGVADDGGEAGNTDGPFGDAFLDVLELVLLITDEAAKISRVGNNLKPVVGEAGPSLLDQHGFN